MEIASRRAMEHAAYARSWRHEPLADADASRQAYAVLRVCFVLMPIVTGVDKVFFDRLTDWSVFVAPIVVERVPISVDSLMRVAGVIEIATGVLVAIRPRIGALVLTAWLLGIVFNLVLAGRYYDIVVRDLGLAAAAFALSRLATRRS